MEYTPSLVRRYHLLKRMLGNAEREDLDEVMRLDCLYHELGSSMHLGTKRAQIKFDYNNCRISCVTSLTMMPELREGLIADARERLGGLLRYLKKRKLV